MPAGPAHHWRSVSDLAPAAEPSVSESSASSIAVAATLEQLRLPRACQSGGLEYCTLSQGANVLDFEFKATTGTQHQRSALIAEVSTAHLTGKGRRRVVVEADVVDDPICGRRWTITDPQTLKLEFFLRDGRDPRVRKSCPAPPAPHQRDLACLRERVEADELHEGSVCGGCTATGSSHRQ